jgi:hypothetical protein
MIGAPEQVLAVSALVMLASGFLMGSSFVLLCVVVWRESRHGYTTLEGQLRHLPKVEPRTGKVLRHAGDPYRRTGEEE